MGKPAELKMDNVFLSFRGIQALTGVSLDVRSGELVCIIGPNGAGKTSLLNCISGFYHPQKGDIYFGDRRITNAAIHKRAQLGISRTRSPAFSWA